MDSNTTITRAERAARTTTLLEQLHRTTDEDERASLRDQVVLVNRGVAESVAMRYRGRGVATEALRLLVSREPERPLFARVAAHNAASIAVLEKNGFTEVSRPFRSKPQVPYLGVSMP